jgi:peptide deformylase
MDPASVLREVETELQARQGVGLAAAEIGETG